MWLDKNSSKVEDSVVKETKGQDRMGEEGI